MSKKAKPIPCLDRIFMVREVATYEYAANIAVKVIDDLGIDLLKVINLE